jgi:hypothetical protein
MECTQPPPLTDDQITAVLDGEGDSQVLAHLERCPGCTQRLQQAQRLEGALHASLWRWDCPAPQVLGEYQLQLLAADQAAVVACHLETCPHCAAEVNDLRAFLDAEPTPETRPQRAFTLPRLPHPGELIAALMPRTPALALRGAGAGQITARAEGITIFLEFQPIPAGFELTGQVIADSDQSEWAGALVELRQAGALTSTATLDELGEFKCAPLTTEPAALRITAHTGRVVVLNAFDLQGLAPAE